MGFSIYVVFKWKYFEGIGSSVCWVDILRLGLGFMNFKVKLFCFNVGLNNLCVSLRRKKKKWCGLFLIIQWCALRLMLHGGSFGSDEKKKKKTEYLYAFWSSFWIHFERTIWFILIIAIRLCIFKKKNRSIWNVILRPKIILHYYYNVLWFFFF